VKENNREQELLVTGKDREREQARRGLEKGRRNSTEQCSQLELIRASQGWEKGDETIPSNAMKQS